VKRGAVSVNPFAHLPVAKSITRRDRVLSDDEIGEIWRAAGEAGSPYGTMIRLLILTGQRRGEVCGMTSSELSDNLATWTISGERAKNGVANVLPLSEPARDLIRATLPKDADAERILRERRATNALVLPGAVGTVFSGWSKSKAALDKAFTDARTKAAPEAGTTAAPLVPRSIHDLRRTVATGLQRRASSRMAKAASQWVYFDHRLRGEKSSCQPGAVHTWPLAHNYNTFPGLPPEKVL
jgi:integrase